MIVKLENGNELDIQRLPLGRYAELLQAFQELPKHLEEFKHIDSLSVEQFIPLIPKLLGQCFPDALRIVPIATTLTPEEVEQLSFADLIEIIAAIFTVNNFQSAFDKLKKFLAQRNQVPAISQPQS